MALNYLAGVWGGGFQIFLQHWMGEKKNNKENTTPTLISLPRQGLFSIECLDETHGSGGLIYSGIEFNLLNGQSAFLA